MVFQRGLRQSGTRAAGLREAAAEGRPQSRIVAMIILSVHALDLSL
jgi:hypothetical protein